MLFGSRDREAPPAKSQAKMETETIRELVENKDDSILGEEGQQPINKDIEYKKIEAFFENYKSVYQTPLVLRVDYLDGQAANYHIDMKWVLDSKEVLALKLMIGKRDKVSSLVFWRRFFWKKFVINFGKTRID